MPSEFYELFDLLNSDIYTDAPEYGERVQRIRELLPKVKYKVEFLAEYLTEAHQPELETDHLKDGPEGCSYCDAIAAITGERPKAYDDQEIKQ